MFAVGGELAARAEFRGKFWRTLTVRLFILICIAHAEDMEGHTRSVAATLAYYDAFRWPLTMVELSAKLIDGSRLGNYYGNRPDMSAVVSALDSLVTSGVARANAGLWTIGESPKDVSAHRVERQKVSAAKWTRMLRYARWLRAVPFVRMIAASGSLAMGSCSHRSDWDVFVVVQSGRLYTARLGLLVVARLMRRLRTKGMRTAPDRFCFNHIVTTDGMAIRHRSLYTAQSLSWLIPFYDIDGTAAQFRDANRWMCEYVATPMGEQFSHRTLPSSLLFTVVRRSAELILSTFVGSFVEFLVRRWMQRRIRREPATHEPGGRIVADVRELEFHPHSFEAVVLARYNASLARMGLGQFAERDSGLTT